MGKKNKHRIRESKIEVDNGVHPLHWAMSPSPSPMGTDPINLFEMVQKMVLKSTSATVTECCTKSLRPLFWKLQLAVKRKRKLKL